MNCKPGDLAIIVKSHAGNEGKIVRCIKYIGKQYWELPNGQITLSHTWETDSLTKGYEGGLSPRIQDELLRPIRDNDGEDEMLRIAGLPQKETA